MSVLDNKGVSITSASGIEAEFEADHTDLAFYLGAEDSGDNTKLSEIELATFIFNAYYDRGVAEVTEDIDAINANTEMTGQEKTDAILLAIEEGKDIAMDGATELASSVFDNLGSEEGGEFTLETVWEEISVDVSELSDGARETENAVGGRTAATGAANSGMAGAVEDTFDLQYHEGADATGKKVNYGDLLGEDNYDAIGDESGLDPYSEDEDTGILKFSTAAEAEGSHGPRSELREKEQWDITEGTHSMAARYQNLDGPQTIMQVHMDKNMSDAGKPPVRVEYTDDGRLVASVYNSPDQEDPEKVEIATGVDPAAGFDLETRVVDGEIQFFYSEEPGGITAETQPANTASVSGWSGMGNAAHFKAGSYNSNKDHEGGTSVEISEWGVDHSGEGNLLSGGAEEETLDEI